MVNDVMDAYHRWGKTLTDSMHFVVIMLTEATPVFRLIRS